MNQIISENEPLYSVLGSDPDLGELVAIFVCELHDRVAMMRDLFELENWSGLQRIAHQLKGAAGSYGFDSISPCAERLEYAIKNNEPEETIRQKVEELAALCTSTRAGVPD